MSDQAGLPTIPNWVVPISTQILSLLALYVGANASVKRFVTIRSLNPGRKTEGADSKRIAATDADGPSAGLDRQTRRQYILVWGVMLLQLVIFVGVQWTKSQAVVDTSLIVAGFVHLTFTFDTVLGIVFARNSSMALVSAESGGARRAVYMARHGHFFAWLHISASLAMASLLLLQSGVTIVTPVLSFAWILCATTTHAGEGEINKIRRSVWLSVGYIAACWALLAATIGYLFYTTSDDVKPDTSPDPSESASSWPSIRMPSEWLLESVRYHIESAAVVGPAGLICMGLRYDYFRSRQISRVESMPDGKASRIPRSLGPFARPTFNAGFCAVACTLLASNYIAKQLCYKNYWVFQGFMVLFTVPAVTFASATSVWMRGEAKVWWAFEEQWGPSDAEPNGVSEVEALDEK